MLKFLFLLLPIFLLSKEITLEYIESKPKSVARDFYIWRFLKQDISQEEAKRAYELAHIKGSYKISREYRKIAQDKEYLEKQNCYGLKDKELLGQKYDCVKLALSMSKVLKTNHNILKSVAKEIKPYNKNLSNTLDIFSTKYPINGLLSSDEETFLYAFKRLPESFINKHLNIKYQKSFLNKLAKSSRFDDFVEFVVFNDSMKKSQQSLFGIDTNSSSDFANFYLAMNSIKYDNLKEAKRYLEISVKNSKKRFEKDKALYWLYLVSKDSKYLNELMEDSFDMNIYTLLAYEKFGREPASVITSVVTNSKERIFNESDPFEWIEFLNSYKNTKDIKKIIKSLNYKNTENFLAYILEQHNNYKFDYFIFPYKEFMKGKDIDRVATLYSIARQESRFIPSAISTSYALGFMQIMPFLAEHIAKELKMNISLDDMLRPEISIKFADYHLDHDLRSLKHPLLVAYAYNAGIGFTRKTIKAGAFQTKNRFEPFWSMEFIPYAETRKYGKKVLANYIVYKKLLGESIQPTTILQSVIPYSQTLYAKK